MSKKFISGDIILKKEFNVYWTTIIYLTTLFFRAFSISYSIMNEKKLKKDKSTKEYGEKVSLYFMILMNVFNIGSLIETIIKNPKFSNITIIGIIIWILSMIILIIVLKELNGFWTMKIIISKNHKLNQSFLFKYFKHPNYYLNMIPEIIAISLICQSWITSIITYPFFIVIFILRIIQEEKALKENFPNYS
jgi:isoprenylcysteine carboxyl methyltransferase (ICMT) family protein YpbQ